MTFLHEYAAYCRDFGTPERIELHLCDLNAVLRGKWVPGDKADKIASKAVRLPVSAYAPAIMGTEVGGTGLGIEAGDPDGILIPIEGTLKPVPWRPGNIAQMLVEMTDTTGAVCAYSPRALLQRMLGRFSDRHWRPVMATELEFYIIRPRSDSAEAPLPPSFSPAAQNYDMDLLARREAVLNDILSASAAQGLATDTLIAEYGPGQFEINFHHTEDILAAAETAVLFRHLVRGVVRSHGFEATFMAKPYADKPGSGLHVHASIIDEEGANIFACGDTGEVSRHLLNAVSGVLDSMRELQAIFAPHGNSYRRFRPNSFAPATPDWGFDNRAAAVRLPETNGPAARLEHRISGADANPYLVLTAILGGMLQGLERRSEPKLPLDHDACKPGEPLDHDWYSAVKRFGRSGIAQDIFAEYRDLYAMVKSEEIAAIQNPITPAEYTYYLSRL